VAGLVAITLVSGCGSGDDPAESSGAAASTELTTVRVGIFPAADVAPIFLGVSQGFFEDEGLELETQMLGGGAAVTAAVVADEADIGFSNVASLVIARSQGLPITIVAPATQAGADASEANAGVVVPMDSDIQDAAGLAGKTVAVNALGNILEMTLRESLDRAGADPFAVNLVEIPFPDMPAMLDSGQVDAAFVIEPFATQILGGGNARVVATPYEETAPSLTGAVYFTTESFVESDGDTAAAFQRALARSVEYAQENPDELRAAVGEYTEISEDVISQMVFPQLAAEVPRDMIELYVELLTEYGMVTGDVDVDGLMAGLD
jgi:NitT/TauT family transport system substrate-binding protein